MNFNERKGNKKTFKRKGNIKAIKIMSEKGKKTKGKNRKGKKIMKKN